MATKKTDKQKMMAMKTTSKIPKTPRERKMWERARQLTAKQVGRYSEGAIPWAEVTHVYKDEVKAGKLMKPSDVRKAHKERAVSRYSTDDTIKNIEKRKRAGRIVVKSGSKRK